jgi:hypothetical protein
MILPKKHYFFIILVLHWNMAYAFSFNSESIQIRNWSSKDITISKEFKTSNTDIHWVQTINDIDLRVDNILHNRVLAPNKFFNILSYSPSYREGLFSENYKKLDDIPIMEKINNILKTLIITDTNGNILLTLGGLKAENIRKDISNGQNYYIIDIYD